MKRPSPILPPNHYLLHTPPLLLNMTSHPILTSNLHPLRPLSPPHPTTTLSPRRRPNRRPTPTTINAHPRRRPRPFPKSHKTRRPFLTHSSHTCIISIGVEVLGRVEIGSRVGSRPGRACSYGTCGGGGTYGAAFAVEGGVAGGVEVGLYGGCLLLLRVLWLLLLLVLLLVLGLLTIRIERRVRTRIIPRSRDAFQPGQSRNPIRALGVRVRGRVVVVVGVVAAVAVFDCYG